MRKALGSWPAVVVYSSVFLFFFLHSLLTLDPDFGWYYKLGEIILKRGIPKTDPFSYTMPSFPLLDHEWLSNIIVYSTFLKDGLLTNLIFALIPLAVIIFAIGKFKKSRVPFILLSAAVLLSFTGIRAQEISWFFFAVLIKIMFEDKLWQKWRYSIPFMFLVWANLHAGFALGVVVLIIHLAVKGYKRKIEMPDVVVFALSIAATFINPYGSGIWGLVLQHLTDSSLHASIAEWLPGVFFFDFSLLLTVAFFLGLFSLFNKQLSLEKKIFFFVTIVLSVSSVRNIPFLIVVMAGIFPELQTLFDKSLKHPEQKRRLVYAQNFLIFISILALFYKLYSTTLIEGALTWRFYPTDKSISVLAQIPVSSGTVFSEYDWGGYLVWKLPQRKVFIDGAMTVWQWKAPLGQSDSALSDYLDITTGRKSYKKLFSKYNIKYAFLSSSDDKGPNSFLQGIKTLFSGNKKSFDLKHQLEKDGWKIVYRDKTGIILKE